MPKKHLLLLPARHRALESRPARVLRHVCVAIGIFVIVFALADVTSRLADSVLGDDALFQAFAPAAATR